MAEPDPPLAGVSDKFIKLNSCYQGLLDSEPRQTPDPPGTSPPPSSVTDFDLDKDYTQLTTADEASSEAGPRLSAQLAHQIDQWKAGYTRKPVEFERVCQRIVDELKLSEEVLAAVVQRAPAWALPSPAKAQSFKCSVCKSSFQSKEALISHELESHDPYDDALAALAASSPSDFESSLCFEPASNPSGIIAEVIPLPLKYLVVHPLDLEEALKDLPSNLSLLAKLPSLLDASRKTKLDWNSQFSEAAHQDTKWLEWFSQKAWKTPPKSTPAPKIPMPSTSAEWNAAVSTFNSRRTTPPKPSLFSWLFRHTQPVTHQEVGAALALFSPAALPDSVASTLLNDKPPPTMVVEKEPTPWVPDQTEWQCASCHKNGGAKPGARHHCRDCGRLVCESCSSRNHRILRLGYTQALKVCDACLPAIFQSETLAWLTAAGAYRNIHLGYYAYDAYGEASVANTLEAAIADGATLVAVVGLRVLREKRSEIAPETVTHIQDLVTTYLGHQLNSSSSAASPGRSLAALPDLDFVVACTNHLAEYWKSKARLEPKASISTHIYTLLQLSPHILVEEALWNFQQQRTKVSSSLVHLATSQASPIVWESQCIQHLTQKPKAQVEFAFQLAKIAKLSLKIWLGFFAAASQAGKASLWRQCVEHSFQISAETIKAAFDSNVPHLAISWIQTTRPTLDTWINYCKARLSANDGQGAAACFLAAVDSSSVPVSPTNGGLFADLLYLTLFEVKSTTNGSETGTREIWRTLFSTSLEEATSSTAADSKSRHLINATACLLLCSSPAASSINKTRRYMSELWAAAATHAGLRSLLCNTMAFCLNQSTKLLLYILSTITTLSPTESSDDADYLNRMAGALAVLGTSLQAYPKLFKQRALAHILIAQCLDATNAAPELVRNALRRGIQIASATKETGSAITQASERLAEVSSFIESTIKMELEAQATENRSAEAQLESPLAHYFSSRDYQALVNMIRDAWMNGDNETLQVARRHFEGQSAAEDQSQGLADKPLLLFIRGVALLSESILDLRSCNQTNDCGAKFHEGLESIFQAFAASSMEVLHTTIVSIVSSDEISATISYCSRAELSSMSEWFSGKCSAEPSPSWRFFGTSKVLTSDLQAEPPRVKSLLRSTALEAFIKREVTKLRRLSSAAATPKEIALFYIDLSATALDLFSLSTCLLHAAKYFLIAAQQSSLSEAERFSLKRVMSDCLWAALNLSLRYGLHTRAFVARHVMAILTKAFQSVMPAIEEMEGEMFSLATKCLTNDLPIFPTGAVLALPLACDGVYYGLASSELLGALVSMEAGVTPKESSPLDSKVILAAMLTEGRQQGWIRITQRSIAEEARLASQSRSQIAKQLRTWSPEIRAQAMLRDREAQLRKANQQAAANALRQNQAAQAARQACLSTSQQGQPTLPPKLKSSRSQQAINANVSSDSGAQATKTSSSNGKGSIASIPESGIRDNSGVSSTNSTLDLLNKFKACGWKSHSSLAKPRANDWGDRFWGLSDKLNALNSQQSILSIIATRSHLIGDSKAIAVLNKKANKVAKCFGIELADSDLRPNATIVDGNRRIHVIVVMSRWDTVDSVAKRCESCLKGVPKQHQGTYSIIRRDRTVISKGTVQPS